MLCFFLFLILTFNFSAGGIATPADAAMMMQLGMVRISPLVCCNVQRSPPFLYQDGVFVGSGIFKSENPAKRAKAIVQAVTHYNNPKVLAEVKRRMVFCMFILHYLLF